MGWRAAKRSARGGALHGAELPGAQARCGAPGPNPVHPAVLRQDLESPFDVALMVPKLQKGTEPLSSFLTQPLMVGRETETQRETGRAGAEREGETETGDGVRGREKDGDRETAWSGETGGRERREKRGERDTKARKELNMKKAPALRSHLGCS